MKIVIPETASELQDWGETMGNCIGNGHYTVRASLGNIVLLGLVDQTETICFAVEINANRTIEQVEGTLRSEIPSDILQQLTEVLVSEGIVESS